METVWVEDTGGRELSETISAESASGMVIKLKTQEWRELPLWKFRLTVFILDIAAYLAWHCSY